MGGDVIARCSYGHAQCYATAGVSGGMLTFLTLARMLNATQLLVLVVEYKRSLHLTHSQCDATAGVSGGTLTLLARAHLLNASQLLLFVMGGQRSLLLHTCSMLRNCWCWWRDVNVPCTCTHSQCDATAGVGGGMLTFVALAHMLNATQLLVLVVGCERSLHLHTFSMLRNCWCWWWEVNVSSTCRHAQCYAAAGA